ncbi:hypothetical protein [Teredinibacter purpureus]|uniref:hypothetical protein n=1 Tax=Teredinibacter purpureus TaxID=2731756 RepID=UPI0005F7B3D6|nr:hypothetical protein [Teredinibacter purpureus]
MTANDHKKALNNIECQIRSARVAVRKLPTLKDKIDAKRKIQALERSRDTHLINYYRMVAP